MGARLAWKRALRDAIRIFSRNKKREARHYNSIKGENKMYSYFETKSAVYFIYNDHHYMHLKKWDNISWLKYHNLEISISDYNKAYRGRTT